MSVVALTIDETCGGLLPILPEETGQALADSSGEALSPWLRRCELRQRALTAAGGLARPGPGLVVIGLRNTAWHVVALLAARAAGHAVALLDPATGPAEWAQLMASYAPDYLIGDVTWLKSALPDPAEWRIEPFDQGWVAIRREMGAPIQGEARILLSTSGTTGTSKFVRLPQSAVTANALQISEVLGVDPTSVAAGHLPLHYSYGLSVLTSHLVAGASVALLEDTLTSPSFWRILAAAEATHFPGVPFHYAVLARGLERFAPASVKTLTQAGGALDLKFQQIMHDQAVRRDAGFYVMYGQTEAAPRITTLSSDDFPAKIGSVGKALSGGVLTVLGAMGAPVEAGVEGDIVYEGPNVMHGYAECRADLDRSDELQGRLATGDRGYLDAEGFLYLTGRAKRFAKVFGLRISLDEVEKRLGFACAVVDRGEKIFVVHLREEDGAMIKQVVKDVSLEYRLPASTFVLVPVEQIPRKGSGKVDYGAVKGLV